MKTEFQDTPALFQVYHFFLHRCAIAKSEEEARKIIAASQPEKGDLFTVRVLTGPNQLYDEGLPDTDIVSSTPDLNWYWGYGGYEDGMDASSAFNHVGIINNALAGLRRALSEPGTFPVVPALELSEIDLLAFCFELLVGNDVNGDTKSYLFLRYPKLCDFLVELRESDEWMRSDL